MTILYCIIGLFEGSVLFSRGRSRLHLFLLSLLVILSICLSGCGGSVSRSVANSGAGKIGDTPGQITVPNLKGMTWGDARSYAAKTGFRITPNYVDAINGMSPTVEKQDPAPGATAAPGSVITLTFGVSAGSPTTSELIKQDAAKAVDRANTGMQEAEQLGIDTSDMAEEMQLIKGLFDYCSTQKYSCQYENVEYRANLISDECAFREKAKEENKLEEREEKIKTCKQAIDEFLSREFPNGAPIGAPGPGGNSTLRLHSFKMNEEATEAKGGIDCIDDSGVFKSNGIGLKALFTGDEWHVECQGD